MGMDSLGRKDCSMKNQIQYQWTPSFKDDICFVITDNDNNQCFENVSVYYSAGEWRANIGDKIFKLESETPEDAMEFVENKLDISIDKSNINECKYLMVQYIFYLVRSNLKTAKRFIDDCDEPLFMFSSLLNDKKIFDIIDILVEYLHKSLKNIDDIERRIDSILQEYCLNHNLVNKNHEN